MSRTVEVSTTEDIRPYLKKSKRDYSRAGLETGWYVPGIELPEPWEYAQSFDTTAKFRGSNRLLRKTGILCLGGILPNDFDRADKRAFGKLQVWPSFWKGERLSLTFPVSLDSAMKPAVVAAEGIALYLNGYSSPESTLVEQELGQAIAWISQQEHELLKRLPDLLRQNLES